MLDALILLSLLFTAFIFSPSCACCDDWCTVCTNNTGRRDMQVVFSGIGNSSCTGSNCGTVFNGTHVLPPDQATNCFWRIENISVCGNTDGYIRVHIFVSASNVNVDVFAAASAGGGTMRFRKTYTSVSTVDCSQWSSESIAYNADTDIYCDSATSGTATLTSL